jgi:hypothetical protein
MDPNAFTESIKDIWELDYVSSSDEEDLDRDSDAEDEAEDDSGDEENKDSINFNVGEKTTKVTFDKKAPGQGKTVPFVARKLRRVHGVKKQQRVIY